MGKTFHKKWQDKFDENKKRKFQDRRNKRRRVFTEKRKVMDEYINRPIEPPPEDEDAKLYGSKSYD